MNAEPQASKTTWNKEDGFTLPEMIMALAIFMLLVLFFPMMMQSFQSFHDHKESNRKEIELFFKQMSREIHEAKRLEVNGNKLLVTLKNADIASYDLHGTNIRRQRNGSGQEIMLQNVQTVSFHLTNGNIVHIKITGKEGRQFERKIAMMGDVNET